MNQFYWPVRVYYEDTDAGGVVFYANYLKFFERARTEMLRHLGFEQDQLRNELGILFVVRSASIDYLKPAHFNDQLQISSEIVAIKKTSLTFKQSVMCNHDLLCVGEIRIACVDANTLKPKPISPLILNKIT